jgi:hypothetical protein
MTDRSFERANDESRARLGKLVETLTPEQLAVDLGSGWTVASALAHTGFWDRWQAERWTQVLAGKWSADDQSVVDAEHLANEALHPYWAAIDADDVPALALAAATHLDSMIAAAPDAVIDAIEATPAAYMIHRHRHRMEHVDHIERAIAAARTSGGARPAFLPGEERRKSPPTDVRRRRPHRRRPRPHTRANGGGELDNRADSRPPRVLGPISRHSLAIGPSSGAGSGAGRSAQRLLGDGQPRARTVHFSVRLRFG